MTIPSDRQAAFEHVAMHLLRQGKKSLRWGHCAYRGDDGLKCAVGCLISDEDYDPAMDNEGGEGGVSLDTQRGACLVWPALDDCPLTVDELQELQRVHDCLLPVDWPIWLRRFANDFGFDARFLEEA